MLSQYTVLVVDLLFTLKIIPTVIEERIATAYNKTPSLTLFKRPMPIPEIIKAGLGLLEKPMSRSNSSLLIIFLVYNSFAIFTPIGKPQSDPRMNAIEAYPFILNILSKTLEKKVLSKRCIFEVTKSLKIIKGNTVPIMTL